MKIKKRGTASSSMAFLSVITCGFGSMVLLLIIAQSKPPLLEEDYNDPKIQNITRLQEELFSLQFLSEQASLKLESQRVQLASLENKKKQISLKFESAKAELIKQNKRFEEFNLLKKANQKLSAEMARITRGLRERNTKMIGGIPIDSEYIIFIIDTSGSMFRYAWPKVIEQFEDTLRVYPKVKGIQILNDMGSYMFPDFRNEWMADNLDRRKAIIKKLKVWNAFSNSSPAEGITQAIESFYSPDKKISIYVYGDEFTGSSIKSVIDYVSIINRKTKAGTPLVRIHAIGFPVMRAQVPRLQHTGVKFATLMRELTYRNGGTFVGLNNFR